MDLAVVLTFKDTDVVKEDAFGYFSKNVFACCTKIRFLPTSSQG